MASQTNSNPMKRPEGDTEKDARFDQETRDKSADALLSLLTHLKRQDDESASS